MKSKSLLLVAVLAVAVGALASPVVAVEKNEANQRGELEKLLTQRRDTLQRLVDVAKQMWREGASDFESVAHAADQLIEADLELAKTAEERVAILQKRIETLRSVYETANGMAESGRVSQRVPLAAKALLLKAQIQLVRERTSGGEAKR